MHGKLSNQNKIVSKKAESFFKMSKKFLFSQLLIEVLINLIFFNRSLRADQSKLIKVSAFIIYLLLSLVVNKIKDGHNAAAGTHTHVVS